MNPLGIKHIGAKDDIKKALDGKVSFEQGLQFCQEAGDAQR